MNSQSVKDALGRLATNHRWTWTPSCRDLFMSLPGWDGQRHPAGLVTSLSGDQITALSSDEAFVDGVITETAALDQMGPAVTPRIAYCSPEFGLTALSSQYAGGLGVLSGDHLRAASDIGLPLAGVGLFYREGSFHQSIEDGHQVEVYHPTDPHDVGATDTGLVVEIPMLDRMVGARVWRIDVGRIPLILLDTDMESNTEHDRKITDRLYAGFNNHRLDQEMILGVGGARALAAIGWDIEVHHLNEGHAGFITLELIDRVIEMGDLSSALDQVRKAIVFTTHTPVPAGIDRFEKTVLTPYLETWANRWSVAIDDVWRLGEDPHDASKFNMAALCLRSSSAANGVSHLHGEVSRELFGGVGIGDQIGWVTNGVHARKWTAAHMQRLFDEHLGPGWARGDEDAWDRVAGIDDSLLKTTRHRGSERLADFVYQRTGSTLDPDALIIGFARRFAPYKRATLLLRQRDRLMELLADDEMPVHFLYSGKAHPSDSNGKAVLAEIVAFSRSPEARGRFTFVPDYDMEVGFNLVQGCDVWLNTPIRRREASGTSGEKAVLNGGLNCSILDGWWDEMYDGSNGWAIPTSSSDDPVIRDGEESGSVIDLIAGISAEYHRSPQVFNGRIRHSWRTLGPRVTAARMLKDYQTRLYGPAFGRNGQVISSTP